MMRIYVTGRVAVEHAGGVTRESEFPSRQSRILWTALVCERARPLPREELAEALWTGGSPPQWDSALKALVSKLRRLLASWVDRPEDAPAIENEYGCYRLDLPQACWVDVEAARNALDEAEGALRSGKLREAWAPANVATTIACRGFLPGEHGNWIDRKRREIDDIALRAMDVSAEISLRTSQPEVAMRLAEEILCREPFHESGYQRLMLAHAARGNRAEAIRVFHRCRELLKEDLGVSPSAETEALYLKLLRES
jgi:SARP family transcriptional regulator, regulator of embCAB operon